MFILTYFVFVVLIFYINFLFVCPVHSILKKEDD